MMKISEDYEIGEIDYSISIGDTVKIKSGFENDISEIGKYYTVVHKRGNYLYVKWLNRYIDDNDRRKQIFAIDIDYVRKVENPYGTNK